MTALAVLGGLLFWPGKGLLARRSDSRAARARVRLEDYLKHIHARELQGNLATVESIAGAFQERISPVTDFLLQLEERGLVRMTGNGIILTNTGNSMALQVIRAHRLLERYLYDELRVSLDAIHAEADRREHTLTAREIDELDAHLGFPSHDPHGDPIPSGAGTLERISSSSLADWPIGRACEIVHVEDEPAAIFSQVLDSGLRPGMHVEILEVINGTLLLWDGESEYRIFQLAAANVSVAPLLKPLHSPLRLTVLRPGERGQVVGLRCEGLSRRRLQDLGITPGTDISCEFGSMLGEPLAFRVRGALVALRKEEADRIEIERKAMTTV